MSYEFFHLYDPQTHGCEILQLFQDVFSLLPIATIIDGKILIVHGGISDQTDLEFLNTIERHKARHFAEAARTACLSKDAVLLSNIVYCHAHIVHIGLSCSIPALLSPGQVCHEVLQTQFGAAQHRPVQPADEKDEVY